MSFLELSASELTGCGLAQDQAEAFVATIGKLDRRMTPGQAWQWITRNLLRPEHPMEVHEHLHDAIFADWDPADGPAPAWFPENPHSSNIAWLMRRVGKRSYRDLHAWSVSQRQEFWATMVERLNVQFSKPFASALGLADGPEHPRWLEGARLNVVDSCFQGPDDSPAVFFRPEDGPVRCMSVAELRSMVARVANGLADLGTKAGDRVAIDMPMTVQSVAIYLGAVAAGRPVVTVADSFAPAEIVVRLRIGEARCIFTQDFALRRGKRLPLYEKVRAAGAPQAIVVPCGRAVDCELRDGDVAWQDFLSDQTDFQTVPRDPADFSTILFSSGTTGLPKAIPWDHTTPIKSAIDAHLHHDVRPGDVLCWPTNMGWMMGPWLVYAALMNKATMALFYGAPTTRGFGQFVQDAGVTMLGLVPSLVSAWRSTGCLDGLNWSRIRAFSSTGECSNPQDMLFLMSRAGYKPVIEYCGGTEIGGAYATGTVVQHAAPATFSTPALGSDLVILDEQGQTADRGEVFLIPPSMGLSLELLNGDHHEVYYVDTPPGPQGQLLRRHGDQIERFANGYFRAHGRADDTMNLGGIKVSSLEIEEIVEGVEGVRETAAIAVSPPGGGPNMLVLYAVLTGETEPSAADLLSAARQAIRTKLNPLFKVHDVVVTQALPRTASNKVMRRALRAEYEKRMLQP
ncbi:MAG: AMP-binding protein [Planctomycetota bacterium]|jgi:acetyl-CoA synthetase